MEKPTRLFSDVPGVEGYGYPGWPVLGSNYKYRGPVRRDCGHVHKTKTIGKNDGCTFHISPTAAHPKPMCEWLAKLIYNDWVHHISTLKKGF